MPGSAVRLTVTNRLLKAALWSICICAAAQTTKTTLSTALDPTSFTQWSHELGYRASELYPLVPGTLGCPFVEADLSGVKVSLMLDTGTARGFVITNHAPSIPHRVEHRSEELNADGSHRGESLDIRVETMSVLGKVSKDASGSLSDWHMFSSEPFDGTVGLDFFLDRRLTLDYRAGRIGATASPLPERLDSKRYVTLELVDPPRSQGHTLYARAVVNRREAIVYFDTGYNVSFIDPAFVEGIAGVERSGKFKMFRKAVPMELGGRTFVLDDIRESRIDRGHGLDRPVAMILGSDVLSRFVITIDLRAGKLILAEAE